MKKGLDGESVCFVFGGCMKLVKLAHLVISGQDVWLDVAGFVTIIKTFCTIRIILSVTLN